MKIIIVGAGISGLSAYLFLKKHLPSTDPPHSITIYESHRPRAIKSPQDGATIEELSASTAIIGGGLGVQPNGMRILRKLDPDIHDNVVAQGFPAERGLMKNALGWNLAEMQIHDGRQPRECCVASSRHGIWQCLRDAVPDHDIIFQRVEKAVVEESGKVTLKFTDGSPDVQADLVIGADGVWSKVRKALLGDENGKKYAPVYEGLIGVGGFVEVSTPHSSAMAFTFGRNGFFGYSPYTPSPNKLMWWSTYETEDLPNTKAINYADVQQRLRERHNAWKDPVVREIISKVEVDSMQPTWTTPDLPTWGNGPLVLVGDAAHALQPTSGQGCSQGLEDVQTLTLLLVHYLNRCKKGELSPQEALKLVSKVYYDIRHPRVLTIAQRAAKMANNKRDHGVAVEWIMYFFIWLMGLFPSIGFRWARELDAWDANEEVAKAVAKQG